MSVKDALAKSDRKWKEDIERRVDRLECLADKGDDDDEVVHDEGKTKHCGCEYCNQFNFKHNQDHEPCHCKECDTITIPRSVAYEWRDMMKSIIDDNNGCIEAWDLNIFKAIDEALAIIEKEGGE